jgi:hypothetical protein
LSSDPWSDDEVVDLGGPFVQMHREDAAVKLYMEIFRGRPDVFARQWYDEETDTQGYVPVRRPMLASDVQDHLRGNRTYGFICSIRTVAPGWASSTWIWCPLYAAENSPGTNTTAGPGRRRISSSA